MPGLIGCQFIGDRRARSDQGHVAEKNINKLRQFIETGFAQKLADRRDSLIAYDLVDSTLIPLVALPRPPY